MQPRPVPPGVCRVYRLYMERDKLFSSRSAPPLLQRQQTPTCKTLAATATLRCLQCCMEEKSEFKAAVKINPTLIPFKNWSLPTWEIQPNSSIPEAANWSLQIRSQKKAAAWFSPCGLDCSRLKEKKKKSPPVHESSHWDDDVTSTFHP